MLDRVRYSKETMVNAASYCDHLCPFHAHSYPLTRTHFELVRQRRIGRRSIEDGQDVAVAARIRALGEGGGLGGQTSTGKLNGIGSQTN